VITSLSVRVTIINSQAVLINEW